MTQPTGPAGKENKKEHDRLKELMERGARTTLDTKRRYPAAAAQLEPARPITVQISGAGDLTKEMGSADTEVHLVLRVRHDKTPQFAALVFLNTPNARADTPVSAPGYAGAVAFFGPTDDAPAHHDGTSIRLPVTDTIKRLGTPVNFSATLVPVGYPGRERGRHAVTVEASLEVVFSKVVPN